MVCAASRLFSAIDGHCVLGIATDFGDVDRRDIRIPHRPRRISVGSDIDFGSHGVASSSFGVLIASFIQEARSASTAGVLASLTLAPIGGCWWPLFITPDWMQNLAKITPHGWANTGFNKLMLFGAEFDDVTTEILALVMFAVLFAAVALWRFRTSSV